MNDYENQVLTDFKVFCPKEVVAKYNHKHQNHNKDWTRFYYYQDKKKTMVGADNVDYDYEVTSTLAYNKNCFYKMTNMSSRDTFFDYYFKLKNNLPKIVAKKSNRTKQRMNFRGINKNVVLPVIPTKYETDPVDGKFIVHFT